MIATISLSPSELESITGYRTPTKQLNILHQRGFVRAYIGRYGVVLERAHYDAVCRGEFGKHVERKAANLEFLRVQKTA